MITIRDGAALLYWKSIDSGSRWYPTREQRLYHEILEKIQGKTLQSAQLSEPGKLWIVAIIPDDLRNYHHLKSTTILLSEYILDCDDKHIDPEIESRDLCGSGAWWKQPEYDYDIVRVLTPWVDGFCGFVKHKVSV